MVTQQQLRSATSRTALVQQAEQERLQQAEYERRVAEGELQNRAIEAQNKEIERQTSQAQELTKLARKHEEGRPFVGWGKDRETIRIQRMTIFFFILKKQFLSLKYKSYNK